MNASSRTPITLCIDTVRDRLALGLLVSGGQVDIVIEPVARGHAEIIFAAIEELLARHGLGYAVIERVAALAGPGSFTGVRLGLSIARGLGLARAIPVLGVPTLLGLSLSRKGPCDIIVDAKRGQVYRQRFHGPGDPATEVELIAGETLAPDADPYPDMERLTRFCADADPQHFPPDPVYVRPADAKPQTRGKVARL